MDEQVLAPLLAGVIVAIVSTRCPAKGGAALLISLLPYAGFGLTALFC
jgi:hypothetical protein